MSKNDPTPTQNPEDAAELSESEKRRHELDSLQEQIAKRLKDNQRFLERFMDDAFEDEMEQELSDADDDEDEPFEEL